MKQREKANFSRIKSLENPEKSDPAQLWGIGRWRSWRGRANRAPGSWRKSLWLLVDGQLILGRGKWGGKRFSSRFPSRFYLLTQCWIFSRPRKKTNNGRGSPGCWLFHALTCIYVVVLAPVIETASAGAMARDQEEIERRPVFARAVLSASWGWTEYLNIPSSTESYPVSEPVNHWRWLALMIFFGRLRRPWLYAPPCTLVWSRRNADIGSWNKICSESREQFCRYLKTKYISDPIKTAA